MVNQGYNKLFKLYKSGESMVGLFFYFQAKNREALWVVYFLHPFFLFMSFSFYEPWVNTAHVNDILTQRSMNNAFEFTFMLELDPLSTLSPLPPYLFSFSQPPLTHFFIHSFIYTSSSLFYSSLIFAFIYQR